MFKLSDDRHVNVHASSTDNLRLGVYRLITHFNLEAKHPFGFFSYKNSPALLVSGTAHCCQKERILPGEWQERKW